MGKYGIVPLEDYIGPRNEKGYYEHGPLYGEFEYRFLPQLFEKAKKHELNIDWNNGTATRPWLTDLTEMLDRHMGKLPTQVNYEGQTYTPLEFSKKIVKLPLNDYVKLTSYSNMPFYQPDILYLKDNWLNKNNFYSLPIDQFIETIDHAIKNNYTLALDLDITLEQLKDSANYCEYREDTMVTQDIRDELLDNWYTKDVHLVHLVGIAHDEAGKKYYIIKDSVGKQLGVHTKRYLSENFVRAKILTVILHKDGIPSAIRRKMKINS
jgi:bleomycin hydrolase